MLRSGLRVLLPFVLLVLSAPLSFTQTFSAQPIDIQANSDDNFAGGTARGDFNQDGNLDLVSVVGTDVQILLGDGHGNFTKSVIPVGCCNLFSVLVGDFNGDSHPDVLVRSLIDETQFTLWLLLGNGDGTFKPAIQAIHYNAVVSQILAGDFNGDGKLDVLVGEDKALTFFYGDGKGNFSGPQRMQILSFDEAVVRITARDVDNDGDTDLLVTTCCLNFPIEQQFNLVLYRNNGKGTFTTEPQFTFPGGSFGLSWADMNQDGLPDVLTAIPGFNCSTSQCRNLGIIFNPLVSKDRIKTQLPDPADYIFQGLAYGRTMAVADFNNDGFMDEANTLFAERPDFADFQALAITRQNVDGSFAPPVSIYTPNVFSANAVITGDFNNDGRVDLLAGNILFLNTTDSIPTCPAGALRTVNLCLPKANAIVSGPVQILATPHSGSPILAMKIYVDGVAQFTTLDERTSTRLNFTAGTHRVTVKAWDRQGAFSSTENITVDRESLCTATADRSVKICSPLAANPSGDLQFRVLAGLLSSKGVQAAQVYVDGSLVYSAPAGRYSIDRIFRAAAGTHRVTVKGWDVTGAFSSSTNVTLQ